MRCVSCDSQIPAGADYCIECGAPVRAATDKTIQLEVGRAPQPPRAPDLPAPPAGAPEPAAHHRHGWGSLAHGLNARSAAIFLIGMGLLILTDNLWPWILALFGLTGAIEQLAAGAPRSAAQALIFLLGLSVLFATGFLWPGILILLGLVALLDRV